MRSRKIFKPILAFLLALASVIGAAPFSFLATVYAAVSPSETPLPYIYIDGEPRQTHEKERIDK